MTTREQWVLGPPGTGKTTFLSRTIEGLVDKRGPDAVTVCSFSRAAAEELKGRTLPIDRSHVGTLHSLCYRTLKSPTIAETKIVDWNDFAPEFRLQSSGNTNVDDPLNGEFGSATENDKVFADYMLLRARAVDRALWPPQIEAFARKWEFWTGNSGFVDFQGMIDLGLRDLDQCPGNPQVLIADEVQDSSASELLLLRKWQEHTDYTIFAFDDDQAIYAFRGASPEALLAAHVPQDNQRVLHQSYRVPVAVHALSQKWIRQVTMRQEKEYLPRVDKETKEPVQGECRFLPSANYKNAEALLNDSEQYLEKGKTVMFLATCGYMLDPLKAVLRQRGLPFHNQYAESRGDWNPLAGREGTVGAKDRLLSYLSPMTAGRPWNPAECDQWLDIITSKGVLSHGAKQTLHEVVEEERELTNDEVVSLFQDEETFTQAFGGVLDPNLQWLENHLLPSKARGLQFPMDIYRRGGLDLLQKKPQITIGTVHSVKGGESDVVYVLPDLSLASMQQWSQYGPDRDAIVRLFYVAMTRAKESLILTAPATSFYVETWGGVE